MANLKISGVYTSTIGSFPLDDSDANRRRCIEDLLDVAVDFPTYPQLIDMSKQFLDDLAKMNCGIILEKGRYKLDTKVLEQDVSPPGLGQFLWALRYLEEKGVRKKVKLKAAMTGPFTLASQVEIKSGTFPFNTAVSSLELVKQFAHILSKSCEKVSEEASVISIDEPILVVLVGARIAFNYQDEDIIEVYNSISKACRDRFVGTHVCGGISPRLAKILLRTEMDFLSHEFHDTPKNIDAYAPKEVKENRKMLSVGCVSSKNPRLESTQEVLSVMKKFRKYGEDLIFTPDCGFKNLIVDGSKEKGYTLSMKKLETMVEAAKIFRGSALSNSSLAGGL